MISFRSLSPVHMKGISGRMRFKLLKGESPLLRSTSILTGNRDLQVTAEDLYAAEEKLNTMSLERCYTVSQSLLLGSALLMIPCFRSHNNYTLFTSMIRTSQSPPCQRWSYSSPPPTSLKAPTNTSNSSTR